MGGKNKKYIVQRVSCLLAAKTYSPDDKMEHVMDVPCEFRLYFIDERHYNRTKLLPQSEFSLITLELVVCQIKLCNHFYEYLINKRCDYALTHEVLQL